MPHDRSTPTRRDFLKTASSGIAVGLVGRSMPACAAPDDDLAVISGDGAAATRKAIEVLGGMSRFVQKGNRVVLKPNMSFASGPDRASNTHPAVVYTVAQMCLEARAEQVMIVDNPLQSAELSLRRAGVSEACKTLRNVYVQMFTDRKFFREIKIPQGKVLDRVEVLKEVLESPVLISLPQAKSHSATNSFTTTLAAGLLEYFSVPRAAHRKSHPSTVGSDDNVSTRALIILEPIEMSFAQNGTNPQ